MSQGSHAIYEVMNCFLKGEPLNEEVKIELQNVDAILRSAVILRIKS